MTFTCKQITLLFHPNWCEMRDSNPRPSPCKGAALPLRQSRITKTSALAYEDAHSSFTVSDNPIAEEFVLHHRVNFPRMFVGRVNIIPLHLKIHRIGQDLNLLACANNSQPWNHILFFVHSLLGLQVVTCRFPIQLKPWPASCYFYPSLAAKPLPVPFRADKGDLRRRKQPVYR